MILKFYAVQTFVYISHFDAFVYIFAKILLNGVNYEKGSCIYHILTRIMT